MATFLTFVLLWVLGFVVTTWSFLRFTDYDFDDFLSDGWITGAIFWPIAVPVGGVIAGVIFGVAFLEENAKESREKARQKALEAKKAEEKKDVSSKG